MPKGVAKDPSKDRRYTRVRADAEPEQETATVEDTAPAPAPAKRMRRTPFNAGAGRYKLSVQRRPQGFHLCWFNDVEGRVDRAVAGGYEFCTPDEVGEVGQTDVHSGNTDLGSKVSRVVGTTSRDVPIRAYLMKIKDEWFAEDQEAMEAENALVDEAIRGASGEFGVANAYGEIDYRP